MAIYLSNRQKALPINRGKLLRRLAKLTKALDLEEAELSVSLVDDREIREINNRYRGVDAPTNVLAFALEEGPAIPGQIRVLGDLVISTETICREAPLLGYSEAGMLYFYLIHGLLHLIGYDHEQGPDQAARQEAETERLWALIDHAL